MAVQRISAIFGFIGGLAQTAELFAFLSEAPAKPLTAKHYPVTKEQISVESPFCPIPKFRSVRPGRSDKKMSVSLSNQGMTMTATAELSVVVPTFKERGNVAELVRRLD